MPQTGIFFDMEEAAEKAEKAFGLNYRLWNYEGRMEQVRNDPNKKCQIGTGGMGNIHVVLGSGPTWLDACMSAGLV